MEDQNVAFRLKGFIDSQGLSSSQFADLCGIPRPSLSQLLTGRNKKISDILVGQIHKAFPSLSILWLLFGEGEMLTPDKEESAETSSSIDANPSDGYSGFSETYPGQRQGLNSIQNPSDFSVFSGNRPDSSKDSNLKALEDEGKYKKLLDSLRVESERKISELQAQLDNLKASPRKVAQITVYYDDSTFETFYSK